MIRLPYPPSLNRYLRHTGRTYKTTEANLFQCSVAYEAAIAGIELLEGDVCLHMTLHPKLTKKGKASGACIDLDNSLKVALDALQGIAYHNDNQVKRLVAEVGEPVQDGGLSIQVFSMGQGPASPAQQSESAAPAPPYAMTRRKTRNG